MIKKLLPLCLFITFFVFANTDTETNTQADTDTDNTESSLKKGGNFSSDRSPGTIFGFGQFILDEGKTNIYLYMDQEKGKKQNEISLTPYIVYGIADYLSAYCSLPLVVSSYSDDTKSRGIGDLTAQFEYVLWQPSTPTIDGWATAVAHITLPTASAPHNVSLGLGTPSFFLGATISMISRKWYAYAEAGATFVATPYKGVKTGNDFLYEWGCGYTIASPKDTILTILFDFNGIYTQKDKNCCTGVFDKDSGGNIIYAGPTLFCSYKSWAFTFGIQGLAVQHLNGTQNKNHFRTELTTSVQF